MLKLKSQRGTAIVEYALIAALIGAGSMVAMDQLNTQLDAAFDRVGDEIAKGPSDFTMGVDDDSEDAEDAGDTEDTGETGDTAETGDTGDMGDTGGTGDEGPPPEQFITAETSGGWITFSAEDGEISVDDYDFRRRWRANRYNQNDGSIVVVMWKYETVINVTAWLDDDGYLQVSVD